MESASKKINSTISQIKLLLKYAEEEQWLQYFENIEAEINKNNTDEAIDSLRMSFKGGMGSFSDLVLHKNGIPLIKENNQLETLKDNLYEYCEEAVRAR